MARAHVPVAPWLDETARDVHCPALLVQLPEGAAMAQIRSDWMWAQALQLLDQAERAHRDVFRPSGARRRTACLIRRLEMPHGCFERRIPLAAGRYELTRRELAQGCLTLTLRKLV